MTQSLFAPWRFKYVTSEDKRVDGECVFCRAYRTTDDRATFTLRRWSSCFALLNLYPYTSGHCMVAPIQHVSFLDELDDTTNAEIMHAARILIGRLRELYHPHGFNVGLNLGDAAGAGIEEHMHLHIVPRWRGDTNMMTVLGKTQVHPEHPRKTYKRLTEALSKYFGENE